MITPVLLAAGASTRMGSPKALCDFDGKAALDLVLAACGGLGPPVVVLGAAREEIQKRVDLSRVVVRLNDEWEAGQTSSLKAGLSALSPAAEAFLIFPVDFPVVMREDVEAVEAAYRKNRNPRKTIFVPSYSLQRGHPVLCRRELADEFLALADDAPARTVMNRGPDRIRYVEFEKPYVLMDMDTPEDYEKCLDAYRERTRAR
ncbi:MAG: nucleotidyltransferase family protein [Planctomycetes bacterium]|nr:nucleotidyltransferase family protein [Planctomycetota bacterium]